MEIADQPPAWMFELLVTLESDPSRIVHDDDLKSRGLEPTAVRRAFKSLYGHTFQAHQRNVRMAKALSLLSAGDDVTTVAQQVGFDSASGFHDAFVRTFDTTPSRADELTCMLFRPVSTPIGTLTIAATTDGICLLAFGGPATAAADIARVSTSLSCPALPGNNTHLDELVAELHEYFAGELQQFTIPLLLGGTDFQKGVWAALQDIPFGQTCSYEQLARCVGRPTGQRAVGLANGANPIAVVIPCHRVVRKDGSIGGYGGGRWRKIHLLEHEQRTLRADGNVANLTEGQLRLAFA